MPHDNRCTKEMLEERINAAQDLIVDGITEKEAKITLAAKYEVSPRQAKVYLDKAHAILEVGSVKKRPQRRGQMRAKLNELYDVAFKSKKYAVCVSVLDRLCKLDGLDIPEEINVNHNHNHQLSQEERKHKLLQIVKSRPNLLRELK